MSPSAVKPSYIIVGAGVFGSSTAYHLAKALPSASITLIDRSPFPCPLAASYDVNKIVRADYGDKFYMELALRSQHQWRTNPLYSQYFHESGMVNIEGSGLGRRMIQNYVDLGVSTKAAVIGPEELKKRYPLFWDTDYSKAKDCYVDPQSGWAEAASAVKTVIQTAVDDGVEYVEGTVTKLLFDEQGNCFGVELNGGRAIEASNVILSMGAGIAKLIADSSPERPDIQVDDRIIGAAVVTGLVKLTPSQIEEYKDMPLFIHRVGGISGEAYPPTPEKVMKFCRDISFSNFYKHAKLGQMISTPPFEQENEGQSNVPKALRDEIQTVMKGIWGRQADGMEVDSYRICWDAFTPNQDFIISAHPRCNRLFIATGGSFHGWKFLPIIGEYVVDLLQNKLAPDLAQRWGWDRAQDGAAQGMLKPTRDLKDLEEIENRNVSCDSQC